MDLHLHRLTPSSLRILTPAFDGRRTVPITASAALQMGAKAVLDGPMFRFCGSAPRERCVEAVYMLYDRRSSLYIPSLEPSAGMTLAVSGDAVSAHDTTYLPQGADVAVQLYPELVRGGRVIASSSANTDRVWRAGLGWDGRSLVFAVGIGTMREFAQQLQSIGVIEAGYTDGGGSAELATPGFRAGHPEDRPKGVWLADMPDMQPAALELWPALLAAVSAYLLYKTVNAKE